MKTLMTAALLAAFALTGTIQGQTGPAKDPIGSEKTQAKKMTLDDLQQLLDAMGYNLRPGKNAEGKVVGYFFDLTRGSDTITVYLNVVGDNIWIDTVLITFNEKTPASLPVVLGFLAEQDKLWPAYVVYYPKTKVMEMAQCVKGPNITPAMIRTSLESFMDKFGIVKNAYQAAKAREEAEAKEKADVTKDGPTKQ